MTRDTFTLSELGWSPELQTRLEGHATPGLSPARIASVHRNRVETLGTSGPARLMLPSAFPAGSLAVGDWVLSDGSAVQALLARKSLLRRHAAGKGVNRQLIAANLDTLFIVTSCNDDFNPARLERYLALAASAGVEPVILLTKSDLCADPARYLAEAAALSAGVAVLAINAKDSASPAQLARWCGPGQTVALLGSSGVGKSTLANQLTGGALATQGIREDDAKGRHTTTARYLLPMTGGGWVIDTPGMRELRLTDAGEGISSVFDDLTALASECRFRDCRHQGEPGCAIAAAVASGAADADRVRRWEKLLAEDALNTETLPEARARHRGNSRAVRAAVSAKSRNRR